MNKKVIVFLVVLLPFGILPIAVQCVPATKTPPPLLFLTTEMTFEGAIKACAQQNTQLPDLITLIGLAHGKHLPHDKTDYWSNWNVGSFAFGWSTRKGLLSFDPKEDLDHVVCVGKN